MKHSENIAPLAAAIGALSTLVCCLPLGIAAAAGAAGLAVVLEPLRPWLLGSSVTLLANRIRATVSIQSGVSAPQPGEYGRASIFRDDSSGSGFVSPGRGQLPCGPSPIDRFDDCCKSRAARRCCRDRPGSRGTLLLHGPSSTCRAVVPS